MKLKQLGDEKAENNFVLGYYKKIKIIKTDQCII